MEHTTGSLRELGDDVHHFAQSLLKVGGNRLELLMVEVQEERERLVHAVLLASGILAAVFFATATLTAVLVITFWEYSHVVVLWILTGLYAALAWGLYRRLIGLFRDWKALPLTVDQLRKDRACLAQSVG